MEYESGSNTYIYGKNTIVIVYCKMNKIAAPPSDLNGSKNIKLDLYLGECNKLWKA